MHDVRNVNDSVADAESPGAGGNVQIKVVGTDQDKIVGDILVAADVGKRLQQIRYVMPPSELANEENEGFLAADIAPPSVLQHVVIVNRTKGFARRRIRHGDFVGRYAVDVDQ